IVTYRDVEIANDHALAQSIARLARVGTAVTLRGLDSGSVAEIVQGLTGRAPSDGELAELQRRSLGNPFFVRELAQLGDSDRAALREGVRDVVTRRLEQLSDACRAMLQVASVIGQEFGLDVVTRAAGSSVAEVLDQLDLAHAARVVEPVDATTP